MNELSYSSEPVPATSGRSPLAAFGSMLGVVACFVGLAIFLVGCAGFGRAFELAWIPLILAVVGLVAIVLGGMIAHTTVQQTNVLAGLLLNVFGLVGGIFEYAFAHGSTIFYLAPVK
jgi:hypothetical protein